MYKFDAFDIENLFKFRFSARGHTYKIILMFNIYILGRTTKYQIVNLNIWNKGMPL